MARASIVLADHHKMLTEALIHVPEGDYDILGTADNGRYLVTMTKQQKPDVVIADISMPMLNGLDAGRQIKAAMPIEDLQSYLPLDDG